MAKTLVAFQSFTCTIATQQSKSKETGAAFRNQVILSRTNSTAISSKLSTRDQEGKIVVNGLCMTRAPYFIAHVSLDIISDVSSTHDTVECRLGFPIDTKGDKRVREW